jgi:hypothetical protein
MTTMKRLTIVLFLASWSAAQTVDGARYVTIQACFWEQAKLFVW